MSQKRKSGYSNNDGFVVSDDNDHNGSPARASKRSKKTTSETASSHFSKASATTQAKRDGDNNLYWEISKARRVVISDFKGKKMISVREYYEKDGQWLPGKKGISMTLEQYSAFVEVLPGIENELRRSGVDDVPRPKYDDGGGGKGAVKEEEVEEEQDEADDNGDEDDRTAGRANHEATSDDEE